MWNIGNLSVIQEHKMAWVEWNITVLSAKPLRHVMLDFYIISLVEKFSLSSLNHHVSTRWCIHMLIILIPWVGHPTGGEEGSGGMREDEKAAEKYHKVTKRETVQFLALTAVQEQEKEVRQATVVMIQWHSLLARKAERKGYKQRWRQWREVASEPVAWGSQWCAEMPSDNDEVVEVEPWVKKKARVGETVGIANEEVPLAIHPCAW